MQFLQTQEEIEKIVSESRDIIGRKAQELNRQYGLDNAKKNGYEIKKMADENRLLQIGIVGRVKAGKSSLLNALIFNGKSILPKAATPMTAALTIITYGDSLSVEVEFFSQEDIIDLKNEHSRFLRKKKELFSKLYSEFKKREIKKLEEERTIKVELNKVVLTSAHKKEIEEKAINRADREIKKDISLASSYDQYERIKRVNIDIDTLHQNNIIQADDYTELSKKLIEYVGADGKYMPFTKSVTIKLPIESLRDIQIIDTPGVNDPVVSREERTRELLKACDAVLIVSPSGQFLSTEDTDLMDRITVKNGIRELYVVASQFDNQLMASIKRDAEGDLHRAIDIATDQLSEQIYSVFTALKKHHPEIGTAYDQLITDSKGKIVHSSGISQSIISLWDNKNEWDSGITKTWDNLKKHYPDYFSESDKNSSIANLTKLANTERVNEIIRLVRSQKNNILAKRKEEFIAAKSKALQEYLTDLVNFIDDRLEEINNEDIDELKSKRHQLKKIQKNASVMLDEEYSYKVNELKSKLKKELSIKVKSYFKEVKKDIIDSTEEKTDSWEVSDSRWYNPFSWGSKHTEYDNYNIVRAGAVRDSIENLTQEIEDTIDILSQDIIDEWKKRTPKELLGSIRGEVDDQYMEVHRIISAFRNVFGNIIFPQLSYTGELPKELKKSGILKKNEADDFIAASENYVSFFRSRVTKDINNFIDNLYTKLRSVQLSKEFFEDYDVQLFELEQLIENKEIAVDSFGRLKNKLRKVGLHDRED